MSEADKMFEELGYKKIETDGDNLLEYKKQFPGYSKFIRFDLLDRIFTSFYYMSNMQSYLNMQELQAINKKVEELRMDMTVRDFLNNILNTRTRKKKYQIRYGAGYYTFYVEDFKFINDANGTGLVIGKILDDEIEVL